MRVIGYAIGVGYVIVAAYLIHALGALFGWW